MRAQSYLIKELLDESYSFVLGRRFQSDPLEKRFSRYRQMSGGRFLVSLREVLTSEEILTCRSLLKEDVNIWLENIQLPKGMDEEKLSEALFPHEIEIFDSYSNHLIQRCPQYCRLNLD